MSRSRTLTSRDLQRLSKPNSLPHFPRLPATAHVPSEPLEMQHQHPRHPFELAPFARLTLASSAGKGDAVDGLGRCEMDESGLDGVDVRGLDVELKRREGLDSDGGFGGRREEESGAKKTGEEVSDGVGTRLGLKERVKEESALKLERERGDASRLTVRSRLLLFFFPTSIHPSSPPPPDPPPPAATILTPSSPSSPHPSAPAPFRAAETAPFARPPSRFSRAPISS